MAPANPAGTSARSTRLGAWAWFLLLAAVQLGLCIYFSRFALIDDAYIAFRYVRNFLHGDGLVFNIGERTEGYTCFLWIILLSLPSRLGISLVPASQVLGTVFLLLSLAASASFAFPRRERPAWSRLVAPTILAGNGLAALWAVHGLETTMFMFLLTMAIHEDCRDHAAEPFRPGWSGVWYGLAALTRPEGTLIFAASLAFWIARRPRLLLSGPSWRHVLHFAAVVVPHTIWRLLYYGDWAPNTYHAKVGHTLAALSRGWEYVLGFWTDSGSYVFLAALPAVAAARRDVRLGFLTWITVAFFFMAIATGGDASTGWRFIVPILPVLCVLAGEGLFLLLGMATSLRRAAGLRLALAATGCALAVLAVGTTAVRTFKGARRTALENGSFTHDLIWVGVCLRNHLPPSARIALNPAGAVPYYSRLYAYDMLGLTDRHIGRRPWPGMGKHLCSWSRSDLSSLPVRVGAQHGVEDGEQLAHTGDDGDLLELSCGN